MKESLNPNCQQRNEGYREAATKKMREKERGEERDAALLLIFSNFDLFALH